MIRCYITDRLALGGSEALLESIERNARAGVDLIQLRERDLPALDLVELTRRALDAVAGTSTRLVVNDRVDVALAAGAHGAHLRSHAIAGKEWRRLVPPGFILTLACHSVAEVREADGVALLLFSPVFPSPGKGPAAGLDALREAAAATRIPVLALGGVTADNAQACIEAGAAGIAAIRLFQTTG